MGHLVNPVSFRLGVSRYWTSKWMTENVYRYSFMFKSDWNIYKLLVRFFSRPFMVSLGFVFSHAHFVRTPSCFYLVIYFWDGRTLENLRNNLKKLLSKFFRYKVLVRFFISLSFFFRIYRFSFCFENFLSAYFWFFRKKLVCLKVLLNFVLLDFFFRILYFCKNKFVYVIKTFLFFFKRILSRMWLKIKIQVFVKQLRLFFFLLSLYKLCLLKIQVFFSYFSKNSVFLDYVYRSLNFFLQKDKSSRVAIYAVLNFFVSRFSSNLKLENSMFKILLRPLSKLDISSSFVARYLAVRMLQRYRLMQALSPVFKDLRKNPLVEGYRIACSGRFTKKEIAAYEWFRYGAVPTNTLSAYLDYCSVPFILKYSMCSFKVWIHRKNLGQNYSVVKFREFLSDINSSSAVDVGRRFFKRKRRFELNLGLRLNKKNLSLRGLNYLHLFRNYKFSEANAFFVKFLLLLGKKSF